MKRTLASLCFLLAVPVLAQITPAERLDNLAVRLDGGPTITVGDIDSVALAFSARFSVTGSPCNTGACSFSVTDLFQIQNEDTALTQRRYINFLGAGVDCVDDAGGDETDCTIAGGGGGSVATDTIWDAKGDLAAGTGADTASKLTVGANDTVLTAASGQATGLIWQTVGTNSITADAVTYAKIQNVSATDRILGREAAGAGDIEELTLGSGLALTSTAIVKADGIVWHCNETEDSTAITNTTTATDFSKTCTIPANLLAAGDFVEIKIFGKVTNSTAASVAPNVAIRVDATPDSLQVAALSVAVQTDGIWSLEGYYTARSTGASGTMQRGTVASHNSKDAGPYTQMHGSNAATFTSDTTAGILIRGNVEWDAASTTRSITQLGISVKVIRASVLGS